jgi:hypothetical protein
MMTALMAVVSVVELVVSVEMMPMTRIIITVCHPKPRALVGRRRRRPKNRIRSNNNQQAKDHSDKSKTRAMTLWGALIRGDELCRSGIISWDIFI